MKQITLSLMTLIISALFLIGCGGGGGSSGGSSSAEPLSNTTGDGNNGGDGNGDGGSNGDGGDERPSLPAEVELSISPFIDGLRIQWHNLSAIEGAGGIYIHLNLTSNHNPPQPIRERVAIEDLTDNSHNLTGLDDGIAYRLVEVRIELAGNISRVIDNITWSEPWEAKTNALDQEGNGIVVGANYDGDGRADSEDTDDDNDGVNNTRADGTVWDLCSAREMGELGWISNGTSDYDNDGCRDKSEDEDDDNDNLLDRDEVASRCVLDKDCDDDDLDDGEDSCPFGLRDWSSDENNDRDNDGCRDRDEDIDDDGDGLIEIKTAAELDAVRHVLNGTSFKAHQDAVLNQTGCGGREGMTICNGYELVDNISLTDFITKTDAIAGWQPIASDVDGSNTECDGDKFTAIFDGNGFVISGLFINRSDEDCIGLFGQASGTIRHLGVIADKIEGRGNVGGLVGWGNSATIVQSYGVSGEVRGGGSVIGGLVGSGNSASIVQSYGVSGEVRGDSIIGGLVGSGTSASIVQSYGVSGEVRGDSVIGGLVGWGLSASIVQSYGVSGEVRGGGSVVGGLVGAGGFASIVQSYSVSGSVRGDDIIGGLAGTGGGAIVSFSYWDTETSGRTNSAAGDGQTRDALRSPTDYTGIYAAWDDGAMIDGINVNTTIWCDEDASGMIEDDERRDDSHTNGDNRVWDFGGTTDYPAIRCTPDSPADQRAWWHLNATHKPELDQTRLDTYLGSEL